MEHARASASLRALLHNSLYELYVRAFDVTLSFGNLSLFPNVAEHPAEGSTRDYDGTFLVREASLRGADRNLDALGVSEEIHLQYNVCRSAKYNTCTQMNVAVIAFVFRALVIGHNGGSVSGSRAVAVLLVEYPCTGRLHSP